MLALSEPRPHEPEGDFRRRKALYALIVFATALAIAVSVFANIEPIWVYIEPLEGVAFLLAATLFGAALAVAPLIAVAALLIAVWHGVESVERVRSRASPVLDWFILGAGILVWFAPALALFGAALRAVMVGAISFRRPAREYLLATDPVAFWQSVGFMLIVGVAVAYPAWHYWRRKLTRRA